MKVVSIFSFVFLFSYLAVNAQDTLIYKSTHIPYDSMIKLVDDYNFEDAYPTIIENETFYPFVATFHKSYGGGLVLVEFDEAAIFESVTLTSTDFSIVTNLKRFVIPAGIYKITTLFERCKYQKRGIDVSDCTSNLTYKIVQPSSPQEDDGRIVLHYPKDNYGWYYYWPMDYNAASDTLFNVHAGYYKVIGESSHGCKQETNLSVTYKDGDLDNLPSFNQRIVVHTKG